uniref:Uncharacterized protein n=1 Tax=Panagrellus redivivus TaxID=6233 RepID=A0A7E4US72_PANRE
MCRGGDKKWLKTVLHADGIDDRYHGHGTLQPQRLGFLRCQLWSYQYVAHCINHPTTRSLTRTMSPSTSGDNTCMQKLAYYSTGERKNTQELSGNKDFVRFRVSHIAGDAILSSPAGVWITADVSPR